MKIQGWKCRNCKYLRLEINKKKEYSEAHSICSYDDSGVDVISLLKDSDGCPFYEVEENGCL